MNINLEARVNELLEKLEAPSLETTADVEQFYCDWMELVWNCKVPSKLFDFYKPDIHVHRENGNDRHDIREVVKEVLALEAAFPDIQIRVGATVVVGDPEHGFELFARRYFSGTNLGYSRYGAPTQAALEGEQCMSLDMLKLQQINGRWQVVSEYLSYSERTFRVTMGGPKEV